MSAAASATRNLTPAESNEREAAGVRVSPPCSTSGRKSGRAGGHGAGVRVIQAQGRDLGYCWFSDCRDWVAAWLMCN